MPVPAAPHWHLKVSACGWLTDLRCNTGSTDTTPGPTASASLLCSHRRHQSSSPIIWFKNHQFGHIFFLVFFSSQDRGNHSVDWSLYWSERPIAQTFGNLFTFSAIGLGRLQIRLSVHVGERAFVNWMNELICYGNEVKADRRPSGQLNQLSRKCHTMLCCWMCMQAIQTCTEGLFPF